MDTPNLTIQQLLEAGVHLGHKTFRWNPKMKDYIFGKKNSIHIIDLVQTLELTKEALSKVSNVIEAGGKILFVSTKKQAAETIAKLAVDTGQFYVTHRWLGGMLTNWKTISNSIKRYKKLSVDLKKDDTGFTKKENLKMGIQRDKLERSLGGIADMKNIPQMIFINDVNIESLAVKESIKLNIPIVGIIDTNSDPTGIDFPIPGNDDARRAINLYCELIKQTIIDAQKHRKVENLTEDSFKEKKDLSEKEDKSKLPESAKLKSKPDKPNKKNNVVKKKAKSLISKIKSLASKK